MKKPSTMTRRQNGQLTIGLDVGDRSSFYCVLNETGEVILEARFATSPEAMKKTFGKMPRSRIALKTGTHSPWISRVLSDLGREAIAAHARNVRLIGESRQKDVRLDAQALARLAGIDPQLLSCPRRAHRPRWVAVDCTCRENTLSSTRDCVFKSEDQAWLLPKGDRFWAECISRLSGAT